jgi:hypothetical protein
MSNLIPEVRVNKNGVPVKKYVRAAATPSRASQLPSPSTGILSKDTRVNNILTENLSVFPSAKRNELDDKLRRMDASEFDRIEAFSDGTEETEQWQRTFNHFVEDIIREPSSENRAMYLNAVEALGDDFQDWADVRLLPMLRTVPEFAPYADDMREAPAEVIGQMEAVGRFLAEAPVMNPHLIVNTDKRKRIKDRELEQAVIRNPEGAEELMRWGYGQRTHSAMDRIDSKTAVLVIERPKDRPAIGELMEKGINEGELIKLVLDNPDIKDRVVELRSSGVDRPEAILAVLNGEVKSTLASGVL